MHAQITLLALTYGCPTPNRPFGSPQYVGLGFVTFVTIVLCELFGSPLMRSASIVIGLVVGYIVACLTRWQGAAYVTIAPIQAAPWITFLWTTTFPLSTLVVGGIAHKLSCLHQPS